MLVEDLRSAHEDVERLEAAIAERVMDEPKHIRNKLAREHEIANFTARIADQSQRALHIYKNQKEQWTQEIQSMNAGSDPFEEFYKQLGNVKDFHKRNPNEPVENLERAYKKPESGGPPGGFAGDINGMFTGEEQFGRYFDLTMLHEEYLNVPGIRQVKKPTYLQYLDIFDKFQPPHMNIDKSKHKMTDEYFSYVGSLAEYLQSFMRRSRPLEDLEKVFSDFDTEFQEQWEKGEVPGWEPQTEEAKPATTSTGEGIWCDDCEKEFKNDNVYQAHLKGKKHIKNAEARKNGGEKPAAKANGASAEVTKELKRLREKAIAEKEHRVCKLTNAMQNTRDDTRVNVERKFGMTDKERQQEIAALYAEDEAMTGTAEQEGSDDEDGDEKVYNPLKLPLSWDGKPIPFWLYKLHGLGVEFACEICGNYVYMGRRAFDKHFSEARHVYGLKCLGITNTAMYRDITQIEEAERLHAKLNSDRQVQQQAKEDVVEMEDSFGTVMPWKVWNDLNKQGLL
jgi:splicing factor 3A subunit 3